MALDYREVARVVFEADDKKYRKTLSRMRRQAKADAASIRKSLMQGFMLSLGAGGATAYFASFEQGLAKVQKTTKLSNKDLAALGHSLRRMSRETIYGTDQLLNIAGALGQTGIASKDALTKFTEVVAMMGTATVLEGDAAVFALRRISKLTGTAVENVENVASSLVALGNTHSATEDQIADNAVNIAAAIGKYSATAAEVNALAAAVADMGQDGTKAATAIGKAMDFMNVAVLKGGSKLDAFANIMGTTADNVVHLWKNNAVDAFNQFIVGLHKGGEEAQLLAESVGLMDGRSNRVLMALAKDADLLARALDISRIAYEENTALALEYKIATDTLWARAKMLVHKIQDIVRVMGRELAPTAEKIVKLFNDMLTEKRIEQIGRIIIQMGRLAAGFIAARLIITGLRFSYLTLIATIKAGTIAVAAGRAAWALFWGAATFGLGLVIAYFPEIYSFFDKVLPDLLQGVGKKIRAWGLGFKKTALVFKAAFLVALAAIVEKIEELVAKAGPLAAKFGIEVPQGFSKGFRASADEAMADIGKVGDRIATLEQEAGAHLTAAGAKAGEAAAELKDQVFPQYDEGFTTPGGADPQSVLGGGGGARAGGDANPFARPQERVKEEFYGQQFLQDTIAKNRADAQRKEREEEEAHNAALARDQEMWDHLKRQRELDQIAWEEEKQAYHLQTEKDLLEMHQLGLEEQDLQFYERMRDLELERRELERQEKTAEREAELVANQRQYETLLKQQADYNKRKKEEDLRETYQAIKTLVGRSSKLAKIEAAYAKAQAINTLITKMPGFAAQAYGQTMAAIPPPLNVPAAIAASGLVMAQQALGLAAAKKGPGIQSGIPAYAAGGMVPGAFSLGDSQLGLLRSREVVVPHKDYGDLERGIIARHREGGEDPDGLLPPEQRFVLELKNSAGQLFHAADQEQDLVGT